MPLKIIFVCLINNRMNLNFICSALEAEQQNYLNLVDTIAHDVTPLGKMTSEPNVEDSDASEAATEGNFSFEVSQGC